MTGSESREFDWIADEDDVIVPQQPAIAIHLNPANSVVLRQRGDDLYDDDSWVWFQTEHAPAIAEAILEVAGFDPATLASEPTPVDSGAAERQRRKRKRKRKETPTEPDIFGSEDRDTITRDVTRHGPVT